MSDPAKGKQASVFGVLASAILLFVATTFHPGGFDWNRHFISTLLRDPAGPARNFAVAGVFVFCVSLGFVFVRLARVPEFAKQSKAIQIAGIGSMVYSALTVTPLHDTMVAMSLLFFATAAIYLLMALRTNREQGFFAFGCACFAILVASATIYYGSLLPSVLPWAQRVSFSLLALWLLALDFRFNQAEMVRGTGVLDPGTDQAPSFPRVHSSK